MWILSKPDNALAFGKDIDEQVDHCESLDDSDKLKLRLLYRQYDAKGYATDAELIPMVGKKDIIKNLYEVKFQKKHRLRYIREDLMSAVSVCPYCGLNEPSQLDHFMDKAAYGQLACCRLNLVPLCGVCNNRKHNEPFTNFVHAYYDSYDDTDFLKTQITVKNNKIGFIMSIDTAAISNPDLARRTEYQFNKISLNGRFKKAGITYLIDYIKGLRCRTDRSLKTALNAKYRHNLAKYRRNHWRTSIIRGLLECPEFNISVVNAIRLTKIVRPENSVGA